MARHCISLSIARIFLQFSAAAPACRMFTASRLKNVLNSLLGGLPRVFATQPGKKCGLAVLIFSLFFLSQAADTAGLYRWVDQNGNVFYSDKVPPKHSKYRRAELSKQGVTVNVVERAKTQAEMESERELKNLRSAQKRLLEEHKARDRSLLRTFRSEEEVNRTLQSKLNTIAILETVTLSNITRVEKQLFAQEGRAAKLERNGKIVPPVLIGSINGYRRQLDDNRNKIKNLSAQKLALKRRFATDLNRFRDLVAQNEGVLHQVGNGTGSVAATGDDGSTIILSVAYCANLEICDSAWKLAAGYIEQHATTPIRINTDVILYTAEPVDENDIALSVSRITKKESDSAQIFLDARCRQSGVGQDLCASDRVRDILLSFRPYIEQGLKKIPLNWVN